METEYHHKIVAEAVILEEKKYISSENSICGDQKWPKMTQNHQNDSNIEQKLLQNQ